MSHIRLTQVASVVETTGGSGECIQTYTFDLTGIVDGDWAFFAIYGGVETFLDDGSDAGPSITTAPSYVAEWGNFGDFLTRFHLFFGEWSISDGTIAIFVTTSQPGMRGGVGLCGVGDAVPINFDAVAEGDPDPTGAELDLTLSGIGPATSSDYLIFGFAANQSKTISSNCTITHAGSLTYTDDHTWELGVGMGNGTGVDPPIVRYIDSQIAVHLRGVDGFVVQQTRPSIGHSPTDPTHQESGLFIVGFGLDAVLATWIWGEVRHG